MTGKRDTATSEKLEIYKLLVEMADRVSQRRQTANGFYLTVNTALIGGSSFLAKSPASPWPIITMAIAGIAVSALWAWNIQSYKTLNEAKFNVITKLEEELEVHAFTDEWTFLDPDGDGKRHRPFHKVETIVPALFFLIYASQLIFYVPWDEITGYFSMCRG